MERFVQLHTLTAYPPSNLNRDDLGRPKTAIIGDTPRLRISSQSLKRAWRTSDTFQAEVAGHIGTRTRRVGERVLEALKQVDIKEKDAVAWATKVAEVFGSVDKSTASMKQLAHLSPEELAAVDKLAATLAKEKRAPTEGELDLLRKETKAADIAMFGRMLADATDFNVDAAVQVSHAFTIHPVTVEDDYFTAVDDLKARGDDSGAGHVNAAEFGSGVFYTYVCINREQLVGNLGGDAELAKRSLRALTRAVLTVSPGGKQNSYASRSYASYALAERGSHQPRTLAAAFLDGLRVNGNHGGILQRGVQQLREQRERFQATYGPHVSGEYELDAVVGKGSLEELMRFVAE